MNPRTPWIFLLVFAVVLFSVQDLMDLNVDYLWFRSLNHSALFWTYLLPRLSIGALAGITFFLLGLLGIFAVPKNAGVIVLPQADMSKTYSLRSFQKGLAAIYFLIALFIGDHIAKPELGLKLLAAIKGPDTGLTDPIFHHDISFYLFRLPFMEAVLSFLLLSLFLTIATATILGILNYSLAFEKNRVSILPTFRVRYFPILSVFSLGLAVKIQFGRYDLLTRNHELISGPGYTDIHATLPAMLFLEGVLVATALIFLISTFRGTVVLALSGLAFSLVAYFIGVTVVPSIVERFIVLPDQFHYERPFLARNIEETRKAYGLDVIQSVAIHHLATLTPLGLKQNDRTVENIRLWDHRPLLTTVRQLQQIRTYYQFPLLAPDRYRIDDRLRQVLLAPRELSYENLPSPNWINLHLAYTHGHGMIMTPVNRVTSEGLPVFWIKNIPPETRKGLTVTHSRIYYGDQTIPYAIVNSRVGEFDFPKGSENVYNHYDGKGGVRLSNTERRILFSYAFGTMKILLSNAITPTSRILFHRNIFEIIHRLAPYLTLDPDPVPIITKDGRLLWMVDGYTTSNHYPYSTSAPGPRAIINAFTVFRGGHFMALKTWPSELNYIRNPVKIFVEPEDGVPTFYVTDPTDPILATYRSITPQLYKPISEMPDDLKTHLRFPPAIFSIMARLFESYHMSDPHTFFNREDLWSLPTRDERVMTPYYTVMRLPGESQEEYVLMLPYTPSHRQNLSAWLVGRSDGDHLGKMTVYTFPKERLIYGPDQIEARIDQRGPISKQLTLWNQQGSHVVRGTLLIIPVADTLLYVEPLYLEATSPGALPELRRVIVAVGDRVVMRKTLLDALSALFEEPGGKVGISFGEGENTVQMKRKGDWNSLKRIANDAEKALKHSDLGRFGQDINSILDIIRQH
jgi:uncharacterized membrane protein (UPF0182 family)